MSAPNFTLRFTVDQTPAEVFNAATNVRGWWSEELEGASEKTNDEFIYHFEDMHYCQVKLEEVIPERKIVWFVKYNYFKFTKDKSEWTGTKIRFDIHKLGDQTELVFTHEGLNPEMECFDICSSCWMEYIQGSLFNLIKTGKGKPNATGKPQTEEERKLSAV